MSLILMWVAYEELCPSCTFWKWVKQSEMLERGERYYSSHIFKVESWHERHNEVWQLSGKWFPPSCHSQSIPVCRPTLKGTGSKQAGRKVTVHHASLPKLWPNPAAHYQNRKGWTDSRGSGQGCSRRLTWRVSARKRQLWETFTCFLLITQCFLGSLVQLQKRGQLMQRCTVFRQA